MGLFVTLLWPATGQLAGTIPAAIRVALSAGAALTSGRYELSPINESHFSDAAGSPLHGCAVPRACWLLGGPRGA